MVNSVDTTQYYSTISWSKRDFSNPNPDKIFESKMNDALFANNMSSKYPKKQQEDPALTNTMDPKVKTENSLGAM